MLRQSPRTLHREIERPSGMAHRSLCSCIRAQRCTSRADTSLAAASGTRPQQQIQEKGEDGAVHSGEGSHRASGPLSRAVAAIQAAALCAALQLSDPIALPPAHALLNSPNAQIARSVDAALRRSIPAFNADVARVQKSLEDIQYQNRIPQRKPWGSMANSVSAALSLVTEQRQALLQGVPPGTEQEADRLADVLLQRLQQLDLAIKTQQPDLAGLRAAQSLKAVSELELLQAPGLSFIIPKDYANLPRLVGRATVQLTVEREDGSLAFVDNVNGGLNKVGIVTIVVDGYSAPITAANFVINVMDGLYDGRPVQSSFTSVFVPGKLSQPRPPVPLEILPLGEFDPVYRSTLDVQNGELPVLPLSISGAVSMAHIPDSDSYLSGDEWFMFKFDKQQAGLSGLAFDEGTFGVFGYVTDGMDVISKLSSGDVIVKAQVVAGAEKLVRPQA